jgi:hypothetical protein
MTPALQNMSLSAGYSLAVRGQIRRLGVAAA